MATVVPILILFNIFVAIAQVCEERDIRITNGSLIMDQSSYFISGGIQICVNSHWATICQNQWNDSAAAVGCRNLGLSYTGGRLKSHISYLKSVSKNIQRKNLHCHCK